MAQLWFSDKRWKPFWKARLYNFNLLKEFEVNKNWTDLEYADDMIANWKNET